MDLDAVIARQEIMDLLHRYCRAVDRRDVELLRSVYHEDALDFHGPCNGPVATFIEFMASDPAVTLHHAISNITIELDGDVALTESYFDALHRREDETGRWDEFVKGRYLDRLERRDGEWRIAMHLVVYDWGRIDPAAKRAWWDTVEGDFTFGRRDRSDPVYRHLDKGGGYDR